MRINLLTL